MAGLVVLALLLADGGGKHGGGNVSSGALAPAPTPAEGREEAAIKAARYKSYVLNLERAMLDDARLLAKDGVVRGPFLSVHCTRMAGVSSSSLSPSEGAFDCLVANRDRQVAHHGHIVEGMRFYGRIDFVHSGVYKFGGDPPGPPFVYGT